jgi:hypothetical protein
MEQDTPATEGADPTESARTGTRTSGRTPPIELISRGKPRRRWSTEQKQAIAAESLIPGVSPTAVARRYGISSGLLIGINNAISCAIFMSSLFGMRAMDRAETGNPIAAAATPPTGCGHLIRHCGYSCLN